MSAGCMRWVLNHAVRAVWGVSPGSWTPGSRFLKCRERSNLIVASWRWTPYSTEADDKEETPAPKKKKNNASRAPDTISNVGRKIRHQFIELLSETGENMGTMGRADVLKVLDARGLKLVLLNENKDPPLYQLMSGKQIHQEQLKLRENPKAKPAAVQQKELSFSSGIDSSDLNTKLKQVQSWLEKKHHVRITVRSRRGQSADNLDATLEQMVQQMEVMVGFVSAPKVKSEGRSASCVLRLLTAKEIAKKQKMSAVLQSADSDARTTQSKTKPVSTTDTTQDSIQQ